MSSSALAPMWTPPINESDELTHWSLLLNSYSAGTFHLFSNVKKGCDISSLDSWGQDQLVREHLSMWRFIPGMNSQRDVLYKGRIVQEYTFGDTWVENKLSWHRILLLCLAVYSLFTGAEFLDVIRTITSTSGFYTPLEQKWFEILFVKYE